MKVGIWINGEVNRIPKLYYKCRFGCESENTVPYLSGSDSRGNGFTLRMNKQEAVELAEQIMYNLEKWEAPHGGPKDL